MEAAAYEKLDMNLFIAKLSSQFSEPVYSSYEINKLIYYLTNFIENQPISYSIINLLQATLKFKYATTTDNEFKAIRNKSKNDFELESIFKNMAKALLVAKTVYAELNKKEDQHLFKSALIYVRKSVLSSVKELKQSKDTLYIYWLNSELPVLLQDIAKEYKDANY